MPPLNPSSALPSSWTFYRRILATTTQLFLPTTFSYTLAFHSAFIPRPSNLLPLSTLLTNQRQKFHPFAAVVDPTKSSSFSMSSSTSVSTHPTPPIPRREEDRVIYAGIPPPSLHWDATKHPRQAVDSPHPLLNPPIPIPDPYGWLRDDSRTNPEILDYLKRENEYSQAVTSHLGSVREGIYKEFLNSLQETDYSTPRSRGRYWYYTRTFEGKSYTAYCRAPKKSNSGGDGEDGTDDGDTAVLPKIEWDGSKETPILPEEEIYLDVNELAIDKTYCSVGSVLPSPSHEYIAYTVDYSGDEKYELHVRNLKSGVDVALQVLDTNNGESGECVENVLLEVTDSIEWGRDDNTLYYMTMDEQQRPFRLYQRRNWNASSGTNESAVDTLLKEELDELYWCDVSKSLDGQYIFMDMATKETSEVWFLATEEEEMVSSSKEENMKCIAQRRNKVLYEVEHAQNRWYIWTNVDNSPNMKLMSCPAVPDSADQWTLLLDSNEEPLFDGSLDTKTFKALESVLVLKNHVVISGREEGVPRVWVYDVNGKGMRRLEFEEEDYDVGLLGHYEANATSIGVAYDSMVTPTQSIEVNLSDDSHRTILKSKNVPGYQKELYECDRLSVLSRDGTTQIPVSVVYRRDTMEKVKNGERVPVHLYGYGSYGASIEADFRATRLPLLERGMIYVIAHIRGGGEMGRQWYEEPNGAKYLCKKNTFYDFVDVAKALVDKWKWTASDMLSCEGRSAGGLLIGASINLEPELFRVAILGVPFVDVVVTMTDATIPLTSGEWVEWGNPNEEKYFQYMMEYSPINNVQRGRTYPSCWLTGGLNDPRVAYWEPAKLTATLRHENPDNPNPICMKMDLSAGHFSASDRYKYYKELAADYAFLLNQLNLV